MRRRAVLVVEYNCGTYIQRGGSSSHTPVPTAERWESVFGGNGLKNLRVEVLEDSALPAVIRGS